MPPNIKLVFVKFLMLMKIFILILILIVVTVVVTVVIVTVIVVIKVVEWCVRILEMVENRLPCCLCWDIRGVGDCMDMCMEGSESDGEHLLLFGPTHTSTYFLQHFMKRHTHLRTFFRALAALICKHCLNAL